MHLQALAALISCSAMPLLPAAQWLYAALISCSAIPGCPLLCCSFCQLCGSCWAWLLLQILQLSCMTAVHLHTTMPCDLVLQQVALYDCMTVLHKDMLAARC